MSRCFSFPPPNYELSDERIGIMMELIELKEEKERRREERRERRNRRKERREKRERTREEKERRERKKEEKRRERKERSEVQKIEVESKVERRDGEMEQSSSLTEEHGYPDSLPVGSSSPENSNKRKNWFTSEASSSSIHQMDRSLGDAVMHGLEILQCKDVVERLLPPEVEDSDWLCPNTRREEKRQRCGSDSLTLSCSRASTPWPPRAQYLHHIDAYALPYILPF